MFWKKKPLEELVETVETYYECKIYTTFDVYNIWLSEDSIKLARWALANPKSAVTLKNYDAVEDSVTLLGKDIIKIEAGEMIKSNEK